MNPHFLDHPSNQHIFDIQIVYPIILCLVAHPANPEQAISLVISGISRVSPLIIRFITYLVGGMIHQVYDLYVNMYIYIIYIYYVYIYSAVRPLGSSILSPGAFLCAFHDVCITNCSSCDPLLSYSLLGSIASLLCFGRIAFEMLLSLIVPKHIHVRNSPKPTSK